MNLEERILSMSKGEYLSYEDRENISFFECCIKLNRIDLALKCTNFLTDEYIEKYTEEILEYIKSNKYLPHELSKSRIIRDALIEKKEYELLIKLDYSVLKEITDESVINELNILADKEIAIGILRNDYTQFRAMELKQFGLFKNGFFPQNEEFYELYYEEVLKIIDQIENLRTDNLYLALKCVSMGDFSYVEKVYKGYLYSLLPEINEIENKYWDKILEYNDKRISRLFCSSKRLFKHYLEQKRFDLLSQFDRDLLTPEFIKQYEREIIENITEISNNVTYNKHLFNLCLKYKKYELCSKFNFEPTKELLEEHGKEIIKHYTELPYYLRDNEDVFKILLELEKYELLKDCVIKFFTDEVLEKHGAKIIQKLDELPYEMKRDTRFLIEAIKAKRYDLIDTFYSTAYTDDILSTPNIKEYLKQITRLPHCFEHSVTLLKLLIELKNYNLALLFPDSLFTDESLESLIKVIPPDSKNLRGIFETPVGLKAILKTKRYDLITVSNISYNSFNDEIFNEYGLDLLTKISFLDRFKSSKILLKIALENNLKHLVASFSIEALDEDILKEYGNNIVPELVQMVNNHKINSISLRGVLGKSRKRKVTNTLIDDINDKIKSTYLLLLLVENGYTNIINKFSDSIFTNEIIDKYYEHIIALKESRGGEFLDNNEYLFNRILQEERFSILWHFSKSMFTNDIIDKYLDKFISYYKTKGFIDYTLESNSYFLKRVFQSSSKEIVTGFSPSAYTEEIVETYFNDILEIIENNNNLIPGKLQSIVLFEKLLKDKNYELIKKMNSIYFTKEKLNEHYDIIVQIVESDLDSLFAKRIFSNVNFVETYIEKCSIDKIEYIDKHLFVKGFNQHYPKLIEWIIQYNNSQIPLELVNNSNLKKYCKDQNLIDLYLNFTIKDDTDKSSINEIVYEYAHLLQMDSVVLKQKLEFLLSKNDEILTTLLPKMLLEKVEQIPLNNFMTITLYPDLQYEILNLNNQEFYIVERILNNTNNSDVDITSILYNVLKNIKHYKKLIANSNNITDEQISNLIYILQRENNIFNINNIEELTDELFLKKVLNKFNEYEKQIENETDIDKLKEMLLLKTYGLDMSEAEFITERYCLDKNIVLNSELDENLKTIIIDLYDILDTNDIEELKFYYNTSDILLADYRSMIYLEAQIRKEYAKLYSKQLYKIQESDSLENKKHLISNPDVLEQLSKVNYGGIKPQIYILSDDFNLEIHALGAYSGYERPADFLEDWNRPKMASHGVCTSFIGNNQIANARAYHPILGFDRIDGNGLLLSANYDIGSGEANLSYKTSKEMVTNFLSPEEIINYTRHTHNEIVIERMKYERGVVYKKAPSYIVYLLDDINNKYNYMTKKELVEEYRVKGKTDDLITKILNEKDTYFIEKMAKNNQITQEEANQIRNVFYYEEVVQASIDMGVPIVIVDRLYYAKRELKKCELIYETLITTDEIEYITLLFLTYFNNMVGCIDYTNSELEYNKCFNEDGFDKLFNKLLEDIESKDKNIQLNYLDTILYELEKESYKRQTFKGGAPHALGKIDPYISTVKNKIDEIRLELTEVQNEPSTKPKK